MPAAVRTNRQRLAGRIHPLHPRIRSSKRPWLLLLLCGKRAIIIYFAFRAFCNRPRPCS
jgi:hypothetical protein